MTCPSAGLVFIGCICTAPQPCFLSAFAHRSCTCSQVPTAGLHRPSYQSYLRALAHGPCFLRYSDITRSSSALSSLHIGSWSHLQCRGVALASLDPLPAEWSLAQWPITPSKALRVAHRTLATMSSVAQLVLLTHSHSSGRPQQMEGKELQSEDPGSHMWPWLGWWW